MGPDYYKVEVLHSLNPHLIWVCVRNGSKICFEQIGIYGILPLFMGIDAIEGKITSEMSSEWMPAAKDAMSEALKQAAEVWFSPTYIDKKTSVFDDNSHKYGDIAIITKNGKTVNLREVLTEKHVALLDECMFHQKLSNGTLKNNLNYISKVTVLNRLEEAYEIVNIDKKTWQNVIKSQMSNMLEARQLEATITPRNLDFHERDNVQGLLENKLNDLKLCKDIEEESAGRAVTCRGKVNDAKLSKVNNNDFKQINDCEEESSTNRMVTKSSYLSLRNKLNLLRVKNNAHIDIKSESIVEDNSQTWENKNKDCKMKKVEITEKKVQDIPEKVDSTQKTDNFKSTNSSDMVDSSNVNFTKSKKDKKPSQPKKPEVQLVGFGPPGINRTLILLKPKEDKNQESTSKPEAKPTETDQNIPSKENSEVNINISNNNNIKIPNSDEEVIENIKIRPVHNIDKNRNKPRMNVMKQRLHFFKEKMARINDSFSSTSDKDTHCKNSDIDSDCESVTSLVNKLDLSNSSSNTNQETIKIEAEKQKNNVNPFKNVDASVFVDKLISPTLMVHTKKGNRIEPISRLRDVPFGSDIHVVLRNMNVKAPMRLQTVAWPTILRGHSVFLVSPHASGKTIGYLPAICRLVNDYKDMQGSGLSCVIICGTSNAVSEVEHLCKLFLHKIKIFACYTGMSEMHITTSLLNGCDLLICTPTMFVRLLQGEFSVDLRNLSTFVIDDCERMSEVYMNELKYSLIKVKETVKNRVNKECKVQYIVASRIWCDFMTNLAKKAPDTIICFGAFQECVLYSETKMSVDFVKKENKVENVLKFLKDCDRSKKTVIACRSDDEVKLLERELVQQQYVVFACDSTMNVQELYAIDLALRDYQEPTVGPTIICCDSNLSHLNITDASYLIHYSLPDLFSMFSKRFSVSIDNYQSIFESKENEVKIKVLLEDCNVEQLPKILNFIKRCTDNIPKALDDISSKILNEKDYKKAEKLIPLCNSLLTLGKCPDFWNCKERHTVFKEFDEPQQWMPKDGVITFHTLHYNSATNYSARILSNITKHETVKFPQKDNLLTLKMGMYYSKEENKKLHCMPQIGDICAVTLKQNLYVRCKIMKVLKTTPNGQPHLLLIKLIDEEKYEMATDTSLYYLPDELKNIETHVAKVILANIMPRDRDVTFSDLATSQLKKISDKNEDGYMRGKVSLVIGNHIFVETLEVCKELSSLGETIVVSNFREQLLDLHGMPNPEQIDILKNLSKNIYDTPKECTDEVSITPAITKPIKKSLPKVRWAHLEADFSSVFFLSAQNPEHFFVRLTKYKDCIDSLLKDVKKHIDNESPLEDLEVGEIVIAEFPDDSIYERARVDRIINDSKVKCFFVDQGDWREVSIKKIYPITDKFITQIPFQAIECKLVGIKPAGCLWTDFETNWLVDNCYDTKGDLKYLYAKYFTKEKAESTDGYKYGVVLLDTYGEDDVVINKLIIEHNLARQNDEVSFLNEINFKREESKSSEVEYSDESSSQVTDSDTNSKEVVPVSNRLLGAPIRSIPLVASDDDEDKWCLENPREFAPIMQDFIKKASDSNQSDKIKELSPQKTQETEKTTVKKELNKPKVLWCQNKKNVVLKIQITVESNYDLIIKENSLEFHALANDVEYAFNLELYGVIDINKSTHSNKGLYIYVNLKKILCRNWLSLTKDGGVKKWIVYDVDNIDVSSDEETDLCKEGLKNIVPENVDFSDSDDDFYDDAKF